MKLADYRQPHMIAAYVWLFIVMTLGGLLTDLSPWYFGLKQPSWKPPDWSFGMIWSSIFLCALFAWGLAWQTKMIKKQKVALSILFISNGIFNLLWSELYFQLHRPDWALIEAIFLWLSVLIIFLYVLNIRRKASLFMLPYFIWTSLAILLNYGTVTLNRPA